MNFPPPGVHKFGTPPVSGGSRPGPGQKLFSLIDHFLIPTDVVIPPRVGVGVEKKKHFFKNLTPPSRSDQIEGPQITSETLQIDLRTLQDVDLDLPELVSGPQIIKSGPPRTSFWTQILIPGPWGSEFVSRRYTPTHLDPDPTLGSEIHKGE